MPQFKVKAPDGSVITVDGPEGGTEQQAIEYAKKAWKPQEPSTLGDMATSFGRGMAKGAIGLAGLPGDLASGLNRGIDYLEGQSPPEDEIGTSGQLTRGVESVTGKFGEPKTRAGRYAQSIGEQIPGMAIGPGGRIAKGLTAIGSGIGAEAGGEVAGEPGRFLGALAGGALPRGAARAASLIPSTPERQAAVRTLEAEGVKGLTAGQKTGSKALKRGESLFGDAPFAGAKASAAQENSAKQFTRAALKRAGINSDLATPDVIDGAFTRIGADMDRIAARNNVGLDQHFINEINHVRDEYYETVQQGARRPIINNFVNDHRMTPSAMLTGDQYQRFRSRLGRLQREAVSDPEYSEALGGLIEALDGAMERSATRPGDIRALKEARRQYRNLIPLANASIGAGEQAAQGIISPAKLTAALKSTKRGKRDYARGQGDFADLARAGNIAMTPLPSSGTGERELMSKMVSGGGALIGGLAGSVPGAAAGYGGGAAAPALVGRALMSRPVQGYLANQRHVGLQNRLPGAGVTAARSAVGVSDDERAKHEPFKMTIHPKSPAEILDNPSEIDLQ